MAKKSRDELKDLFPEANVIEVVHKKTKKSETVGVEEFGFGDLACALAFLDKYQTILYKSSNPGLSLMSSGKEALDDVASLVLLATGKDREWLDGLTGGSSLDLIYKILEVNFDFFIQRFQKNSIALAKKLNSPGQTPQPNLSPTDIDGQTSEPILSSK